MRGESETGEDGDEDEVAALQAALRDCVLALRQEQPAMPDLQGLPPASAWLIQRLVDEIAASQRRLQGFREAVDTIRDGFAIFDPDLALSFSNRSFRSFFEPVISCDPGVNLLHLVKEAARQHLIELDARTIEVWREQIDRDDGRASVAAIADGRKYRWYAKRDSHGNLIYLASNVTVEIDRQQALAAAQKAAEQAAEAKTKFLTHMSHELRTPMNGILGMAELLCDSDLAGECKVFAETIRSSAEALLHLINDVLEFTRGEHHGVQITHSVFDLEWLAAEVVTLLHPNAAAKGLRLSMSYDPLTPASFHGDAGRIRQIMLNLLGNGIKYTPEGAVQLRILQQRSQVVLTVEDSGPGIPEDKVDSIFEKFSQLGEPAIAERNGSGLGLAITAQLVQAMDGQLWQTNLPDGGSCFGVSLPLPPATKLPRRVPGDIPGGKLLVMIQPDPGTRRRLHRTLGAAGLRARIVADAAAAVESIRRYGRARWILIYDDNPEEPPALAMERLEVLGRAVEFWLVVGALRPSIDPGRFSKILRLPFTRQAVGVEIREALASELQAMPGPMRRMRVLIADDNATNRLIIEKMLRDCNIDLVSAQDGKETVDLWSRHRPDLILMDISMPVMDGREASRTIREIEAREHLPRTSIVAVTADAVRQDGNGVAEFGINEVVVKPIRRSVLLSLIRRFRPDLVLPPIPDHLI
ncbi:ATP-binding protein [uncultured Paracoccus sp.]|uniref:ATP-binding protein n=1 Tax=uncultured Paracoccus sp. TaxID=189685 RepID=UPI00262E5C8B|nr:ATP-binding protein [uncultured Paracoccus sp.]